jgi:D-inositol-3-phosphate glycosyltransferase
VLDFLAATAGLPRVVVGDGPLRAAVPDAVGFVPPRQLGAYYERASIVCVPSRREGYGVVAREAMAYGRPVVACAVGGLLDAVGDGQTGLLVPAADPPALRAALVRLLDDPALRKELGHRARERAIVAYSWDAALGPLLAVYRTAAGAPG